MSHHSQLPSAISISVHDVVHDMDMANFLSQDHDSECGSLDDAQADGDHLQKLKELFEQNAELITPGYRETIDSILSNYGAVRDEVEENPRIGLVLSAEFTATPTQQSFPALPFDQADGILDEGLVDLVADRSARDSGGTQLGVAQDPMVDYTEYLLHVTNSTSNDPGSYIEESSPFPDDTSDGYLTQDTETTWNDQERTCWDIYAHLDTGLFQDCAELDRHVDEDQMAKAVKETDLMLKERQGLLPRSTVLTTSPVMQVAAFSTVASTGEAVADEPVVLSGDDRESAHEPPLTSDAGQTCIKPSLESTEHIEAASHFESSPNVHGTIVSRNLHAPAEGRRSYAGSLVPENSATNIVVSAKHQEGSYRRNNKVVERPILGYDDNDLLEYIPDRLQDDLEQWLEQVGGGNRLSAADKDHEQEAAASSFFAWLTQDGAAEYVLDAGMAVAFAAVAVAGLVFK
ncbi:hypothetical protein E8E11_007629 [Didymella keratinophila]|nr:hypothetical protein E8E11_007629 [Didymella keratinophila]